VTNFDHLWFKVDEDDKIMRDEIIFHLTKFASTRWKFAEVLTKTICAVVFFGNMAYTHKLIVSQCLYTTVQIQILQNDVLCTFIE